MATAEKVNLKLDEKNVRTNAGSGALPKPLSMIIFRANGFSKAIGVARRFRKKSPVM